MFPLSIGLGVDRISSLDLMHRVCSFQCFREKLALEKLQVASWGIFEWTACPFPSRSTSDQVELGLREGESKGLLPALRSPDDKSSEKTRTQKESRDQPEQHKPQTHMLEPSSWTIAGDFLCRYGLEVWAHFLSLSLPLALSLITLGYGEAEP